MACYVSQHSKRIHCFHMFITLNSNRSKITRRTFSECVGILQLMSASFPRYHFQCYLRRWERCDLRRRRRNAVVVDIFTSGHIFSAGGTMMRWLDNIITMNHEGWSSSASGKCAGNAERKCIFKQRESERDVKIAVK